MDIKINHTKLDVNTQNVENEIHKPQIEEVDLKLDSQTKDNLNRQIPEENLDFNLTKLDLSVSLQNSSSEIPFEEDFKGFDTDKENGFSNSEKYKNISTAKISADTSLLMEQKSKYKKRKKNLPF